ncbi:MAG TPA: AraC family ligand binding domain-containing protein, partial [Longimicrobium sp.]
GRLQLFANGAWTEAGPGSAIFLPRGEPHTFRNATELPTSHWVVATPSGFEEFYARWSDLVSAPGEPDMNRMMKLCDEHGIEILGPPPPMDR